MLLLLSEISFAPLTESEITDNPLSPSQRSAVCVAVCVLEKISL